MTPFPTAAVPHVLLWFEIPVDDSQAVQMVEPQSQLCQVELHVLLGEHDLEEGDRQGHKASSDHLHCTHAGPFTSTLLHPSFPDFTHHPELSIKHRHQNPNQAAKQQVGFFESSSFTFTRLRSQLSSPGTMSRYPSSPCPTEVTQPTEMPEHTHLFGKASEKVTSSEEIQDEIQLPLRLEC